MKGGGGVGIRASHCVADLRVMTLKAISNASLSLLSLVTVILHAPQMCACVCAGDGVEEEDNTPSQATNSPLQSEYLVSSHLGSFIVILLIASSLYLNLLRYVH